MYNLRSKKVIFVISVLLLFTTILLSAPLTIPANKITIRSMATDETGTLWIATFGKGLWQVRNNKIAQLFDSKLEQPYPMINSLTLDKNHLWITTAGKGCVAYNLQTKIFDILPKTNTFDRLHGFVKTSKGKVLIGSVGSGSAFLSNNQWTAINPNTPPSRKWVNCFAEWNDKLWIGTSTGIYSVLINEIKQNWHPKSLKLRKGINCILPTSDRLIIGTTSDGVYTLKKNDRPRHFKNTYGSIYQIISWKNGLWATGQYGIWKLSEKNSEMIASYKFKTPKSLTIDTKGNLIIGTTDGKLISTSDGKNFTIIMKFTKKGLEYVIK